MPYIITTLNTAAYGEPMEDQTAADVDGATRTAVATLDEAQESVRERVEAVINWSSADAHADTLIAAENLPKSGGTIGPLPDGTVIEVRQASWHELSREARGTSLSYRTPNRERAIIAAFNAA